MADSGVKFIRVNGRVVPVKAKKGEGSKSSRAKTSVTKKSSSERAQSVLVVRKKKREVGERFRDGAVSGAVLGGIVGAFDRNPLIGAAAGAIGTAALFGGIGAAFGARNKYDMRVVDRKVRVKRRKNG